MTTQNEIDEAIEELVNDFENLQRHPFSIIMFKKKVNKIAIPRSQAISKKVLDKILTPQLFHDIYEQEARKSGWETHKNCINKKFDDLPETNQEAMINTIRRIKELLASEDKT